MKALFSVAAVVAVAGSAEAEIRIIVDPTVPFTERDLAEAVRLRSSESSPADVVVRVGRLGFDQVLVAVGDKSETVTLPDRDRVVGARVVAMIVTSLVEGDGPPGEVVATVPAPATPSEPLWSVILGAGLEHHSMKAFDTEDGLDSRMLRGGVARSLGPSLRAIATAGIGLLKPQYDTHTKFVPIRLGLEAATGPLGLEIGGQDTWYSNEGCNGHWGHSYSVYGAAKVLVPLVPRAKLVVEVGGHYVVKQSTSINDYCLRFGDWIQYGGFANAGLEWAL